MLASTAAAACNRRWSRVVKTTSTQWSSSWSHDPKTCERYFNLEYCLPVTSCFEYLLITRNHIPPNPPLLVPPNDTRSQQLHWWPDHGRAFEGLTIFGHVQISKSSIFCESQLVTMTSWLQIMYPIKSGWNRCQVVWLQAGKFTPRSGPTPDPQLQKQFGAFGAKKLT